MCKDLVLSQVSISSNRSEIPDTCAFFSVTYQATVTDLHLVINIYLRWLTLTFNKMPTVRGAKEVPYGVSS
jgi:hypothetical protein